jgi:hypothetical protein
VISVTHVSIYRKPEVKCSPHRLETDLRKSLFRSIARLIVAVAATESPDPSFYLLYFNRSRSDALHGGFSGLARGYVKSRARKGALENLVNRNAPSKRSLPQKPPSAYTAVQACCRITSTEHFAWSATASETLPITIRSNPLRPWEPSTIISTFHFSASSKIT